MRPLNAHLGGARFVALLHERFYKLRLIELGGNDDILTLLHICTDARYEPCIVFYLFSVHILNLLSVLLLSILPHRLQNYYAFMHPALKFSRKFILS